MKTILILLLIFVIIEIPTCFGMGLIFKKMNLDFNKGIIPFYNKIILINKYRIPQYNLILIFIPIISIYTNYLIYKEICKQYKKDKAYVIELTLFPFIYNIFLGIELKEEPKEKEKPIKDEYTWYPKQKEKSSTIYKATRNDLKTQIEIDNNIIETKKIQRKEKDNKKECPNCKAKIPEYAQICPVCGTKI